MTKKDESETVSESEESESDGSEDQNKPKFISQSEIVGILFSRETLYHVLALFIILAIFGILSSSLVIFLG